jgi:glutamine synthetase
VTTDHFKNEVLPRGMLVPAYLLATDATGALPRESGLTSATNGYPDLRLRVDLETLFRMPWQPGTVGVLGDLEQTDGSEASLSPREILRRQILRAEKASLLPTLGAEPQFTLFSAAYPDAADLGFDALTPAGSAGATHQAFRSARAEPFQRRLRRALTESSVPFEGTTGLLTPAGYEVTLLPGSLLRTCDSIQVTRAAIRDIAVDEGLSATFMSSYWAGVGTACHLHVSLRNQRGGSALSDRYGVGGLSEVGRAFVAGLLERADELSLLYAPTVNSYRRFAGDPLSPSAANWGVGNRTCAIRVVGEDSNLRIENRLPGSDANPYLATAALLAAGLDGIARQLRAPEPVVGNGHTAGSPALSASLAAARASWLSSAWVREAFGADVQEHLAGSAQVEIDTLGHDPEGSLTAERARYFDIC